MELKEASRHYLLYEHLSPLNDIMHQADLNAEMQYHKDIEAAFKAGAQWARDIMHRDFETTIGFIDMLNHLALTKKEHKLLDYILGRCVDNNALRHIRRIYQPEHLKDIKMDYPLTPDECFKLKEDER